MTNTMQLEGITLNYEDKEIEQMIESRNQELQNMASQMGKKHGFENKPAKGEKAASYTSPITAGYNLLNTEVHTKLHAGNQLKYGSQDTEQAKKKDQELELKKDELDNKIKCFAKEDTSIPWTSVFKLVVGLVISLVILLGEQEYISKSVQVTGTGFLSNRIMAIGISLIVLLIAHFSKYWISKLAPKQQKLALIGIHLLVGLIFLALAIFRQAYFKQLGLTGMPIWAFVLINIAYYYGFYLVSNYLLLPAIEEIKLCRTAIARQRSKNKVVKEKKQVEDAIKENKATLDRKSRLRIAVLSYAKSTEERIERLHEQAIAAYIQANRDVRTEAMPELNEPIPSLKKYYENINL